MKDSKAHSLRTEQAVARFGKAARHPLCLAALELWALDAESSKREKDASFMKEILGSAEQQKKQARALLDQFYKDGKEKEAIEAGELLNKTKEHLAKTRKAYQALVKLLAIYYNNLRPHLAGQLERELLAAKGAKNKSALKALPRVQKRWKALSNGERLKYSETRELRITEMLRNKKIKAEWAKGGALAGYTEAAFGGNRLLYDDEWQGRLTAREIHSHLKATDGAGVAGDKDAKEVRRSAGRLRIRLDEDQRGRKWKPPHLKKQKPTPLKRPPKRPVLTHVSNVEGVEARAVQAKGRVVKVDFFTKTPVGSDNYKIVSQIDSYSAASARAVMSAIESEIKRLTLRRGGRKGIYVY